MNNQLEREIARLREALKDPGMEDIEFREFLDLLMCSDSWPVQDEPIQDDSDDNNESVIKQWADRKAQFLGYRDWVHAYHNHMVDDPEWNYHR